MNATPKFIGTVLLLTLASLLPSCKRQSDTELYTAPKEPARTEASRQLQPEEQIQWNVPEGWKPLPAREMRFASFAVDDTQPPIELTVIPLPAGAGSVPANVNRWEQQLGLKPTPADQLNKVVTRIESNGLSIDTVDLTGTPAGQPAPLRMLAAMLSHSGQIWFFKVTGPADKLAAQKPKFESFLKSIRFVQGAPPPVGAGPATAPAGGGALPAGHPPMGDTALPAGHPPMPGGADAGLPAGHPPMPGGAGMPGNGEPQIQPRQATWSVPAGWEMVPGQRMMREATFQVKSGDKVAEVIISKLGGNFGTMADNINRWRAQVGMKPLANPAEEKGQPVTIGGAQATVYDFATPEGAAERARMLVAMVKQGDDSWFFKMIGPVDLVGAQKPAFESFLKSVKFASAEPEKR